MTIVHNCYEQFGYLPEIKVFLFCYEPLTYIYGNVLFTCTCVYIITIPVYSSALQVRRSKKINEKYEENLKSRHKFSWKRFLFHRQIKRIWKSICLFWRLWTMEYCVAWINVVIVRDAVDIFNIISKYNILTLIRHCPIASQTHFKPNKLGQEEHR